MKNLFYVTAASSVILFSCNGGNTNTGIPAGNMDSSKMDSNRSSTALQIDSTDLTQPTDTAPYHRKFSKEDSARLKPIDSVNRKMNNKH